MDLPTTGTAALLDLLSPFVPDDEIQSVLPRRRGGRRAEWSSAQLLRVSLLLLLTPARSVNLLCELLPEQRAWRRFAHLPNLRRLPNPRQLHEFRLRLTPGVLRGLNALLLQRVMATWPAQQPGVALIDATDLPAATCEYKKSPAPRSRPGRRRLADARSRPAARATLSGIRNTRCASGSPTTNRPGCSSL
jgi:hypothetical protein